MSAHRIVVMGGSYNPVHIGHMLLADYMVQFLGFDETWMMLSPRNPLKQDAGDMAPDASRLEMLKIACRDTRHVKPCDVELSLPRPSYSITSLTRLQEQHPDCSFRFLIGSDNWLSFSRWREPQQILDRFKPIVYMRPGYPVDEKTLPEGVTLVREPVFEISSTFIRRGIASGRDMRLYLPEGVWQYITEHNLYR